MLRTNNGRFSAVAQIVGMLMYLATCTHLDVAHTVGMLARFMVKPWFEHWKCVKLLLQHFTTTQSIGHGFGATEEQQQLRFALPDQRVAWLPLPPRPPPPPPPPSLL